MFERFTERSRQVVVEAQNSARSLNHNFIGTEHVLAGLVREAEGLAAVVLKDLGITEEVVTEHIVRIAGRGGGDGEIPDQIPFTPRAKRVFELALREALALGHNYIGTEHILLALIRENEGVAARILLDLDADSERIRNEVIRLLSGATRRPEDKPTTTELADATAQDVIDALRLAFVAQDNKLKRAEITRALLEHAPETASDRGTALLIQMICEGSMKVEVRDDREEAA